MATYSPITTAIISLSTATFERAGFGIQMFMAAHNAYSDRVRYYTDAATVGEEIGIESPAHKAAQAAFAQDGATTLMIGRIGSDEVLSFATAPVQNDIHTITIEVNDGDSVVVSITDTDAVPTAETVFNKIKLAIDAVTLVTDHVTATVVGTGAAATLVLSRVTEATDQLIVTGLSDKLVSTPAVTETGAEAYSAIKLADDSFYFVTSQIKTQAWIESLGAAVNADTKQYWYTTSDINSLTTYAAGATDLGALAIENQWARAVSAYAQDAETEFPEVGAIAFKAYTPAGTIVWGNDLTSGITEGRDADGNRLTVTQKNNLLARNMAFWDYQGGNVFLNSDVYTGNGMRPEDIRGRDSMVVDIVSTISSLLLSQRTTKIPYNDSGIQRVVSMIDKVLQDYVQRGFIEPTYVITAPRASSLTASERGSQKLDKITFTAQLSGAITMVDTIRGVLQLDEVLA